MNMEGTREEEGFVEKYKTPKELLDTARIDGKSLNEVWGFEHNRV